MIKRNFTLEEVGGIISLFKKTISYLHFPDKLSLSDPRNELANLAKFYNELLRKFSDNEVADFI